MAGVNNISSCRDRAGVGILLAFGVDGLDLAIFLGRPTFFLVFCFGIDFGFDFFWFLLLFWNRPLTVFETVAAMLVMLFRIMNKYIGK